MTWPGFQILAKDFVEQMYLQAMRDEPDVRLSEQVLDLKRLDDGILELTTSKAVRHSKSVIIAGGVGAFEPKRLEAPGVEELTGKGIHYFAKRVEDFRDKKVVIVGGGDSAVDWALTLEPIAKKVTVIHRSQFRARIECARTARVLGRSSLPEVRSHRGQGGRAWPPG
ncbi:MAG: NAD(P)/FAD-dependent oxidoreductase [Thermomicrobiales bacterium]